MFEMKVKCYTLILLSYLYFFFQGAQSILSLWILIQRYGLFMQDVKVEGTKVTMETCTHGLPSTAEDVPEEATHYKCAPTFRHSNYIELLWKALMVLY
jgi:hypothetical protein